MYCNAQDTSYGLMSVAIVLVALLQAINGTGLYMSQTYHNWYSLLRIVSHCGIYQWLCTA